MITLSVILETLWTVLTIPYRVWKSNYHSLPTQEQDGVKIVFSSYLIMLTIVILWIVL